MIAHHLERPVARACVVLALLALAACTRPKKHEGAGVHAKGSCDITLSGAQTGSFKCGGQDSPSDGPLLTYDAAKDQTNVNEAFNAPGDAPDCQVGLGFTGKATVGTTYSLDSPGADGQATVHRGDQRWTAASKPLAGAITITFTTLDGSSSLAGRTAWSTMHGTIVATMPAAGGGAKGTVTATAKF